MFHARLALLFAACALPACAAQSAPGGDAKPAGTGGQPAQGGRGGGSAAGGAGGNPGSGGTGGGAGNPDAGGTPDAAAACQPASALVCDTLAKFPPTLKATGLFPAAPTLTPAAQLKAFTPKWELWSDGLGKTRFLLLPPGGKINNDKRDAWLPPFGTIFVKTFFADGPKGAGTKPVETRLIRRVNVKFREYEFAVYLWNADGSDAQLLDITENTPAPVMVNGKAHTHQVPKRTECEGCHEKNYTTVIGFDELRLNAALPGAQRTQLEELAAADVFTSKLPADPVAIPANDPLQPMLGWIQGNCAHCHNGKEPGVVDLRYPDFVKNTVKQMTEGQTARGWRVDPGSLATSILYQQLIRNATDDLKPMPPIAVQQVDAPSVDLVKNWILSLPKQ